MTQLPGEMQREAAEAHRRETLREILLPFGAGLAGLIIVVVFAALISQPIQFSKLADLLLTVLVLCPLALCTLPFALLLVVAAVAMNQVHDKSASLLGKAVNAMESVNRRIDRTTMQLADKAIDFNVKVAPVERLVFSAFDKPEANNGVKANDDSSDSRR